MFYTNYDFNTIEELEKAINDFKFYYKVDKYTINKQTKEYTHNTTKQIVLEMFITKNHNLKLHTKDDIYKIEITHEDDNYKIEFLSKKEEQKWKDFYKRNERRLKEELQKEELEENDKLLFDIIHGNER